MKYLLTTTLFLTIISTTFISHAKNFDPKRELKAGSLILRIKKDLTADQKENFDRLIQKFDLRPEKKMLNSHAGRYQIGNPNFAGRETQIATEIENSGTVEFVEPNYVVRPAFKMNDAYYTSQWHHEKIKSERAWRYTTGNKSVTVAVCDAGFDLNHPDSSANFQLPGFNTVTGDSTITPHAHGTQTTGVLGSIGSNSIGVAGMAWQIQILPIQISMAESGGSTIADVAECIIYAADQGAKVVSISYDFIYTDSITDQAAAYMRSKGGIVTVAAGNSASDISVYGNSPNMLVIGASDSNDQMSFFSNFGLNVDLYAPGQGIFTTDVGGFYTSADGTSFSTPMVAGTAALIYSLNPNFQAQQVEELILSSVTTLTNIKRLDAGAAVRRASALRTGSKRFPKIH